jgi:hypothetical protein
MDRERWRKHQEDRSAVTRGWHVDWFSSAPLFRDWQEHGGEAILLEHPPSYDPLVVQAPQTWLLSVGWKISGPICTAQCPLHVAEPTR